MRIRRTLQVAKASAMNRPPAAAWYPVVVQKQPVLKKCKASGKGHRSVERERGICAVEYALFFIIKEKKKGAGGSQHCNRLDLETLGSRPIVPRILPGHCFPSLTFPPFLHATDPVDGTRLAASESVILIIGFLVFESASVKLMNFDIEAPIAWIYVLPFYVLK
jgi:hypothetical protein